MNRLFQITTFDIETNDDILYKPEINDKSKNKEWGFVYVFVIDFYIIFLQKKFIDSQYIKISLKI